MSTDDQKLEVEITLVTRKGGASAGRRRATPAPDPPRIPRVVRLMALAIKFQDMVDRGEVRDYADIARLGFVTRARLTQIMNLLLLAPEIQGRLLYERAVVKGGSSTTERDLRAISRLVHWDDQVNCIKS